MKNHSHKKKHGHPVLKVLKIFSCIALLSITFALVTERAQLPQKLRDSIVVIALYNTADILKKPFGATPFEIEPAAGTGSGYNPDDRARLDALILKGSEE